MVSPRDVIAGDSFSMDSLVDISGRNKVMLFFGGGPYPGADTGFPEGGGGEDIHKHPPLDIGHCPRDVIRPPKN